MHDTSQASSDCSFMPKTLEALSQWSIGTKINIILLTMGILPPLAALLLLQQAPLERFSNMLALYIAAAVLLYYPLGRFMEEIIVLRQTRRINGYVEEIKAGRHTPSFTLPEEKGNEHDFLRLQRNIFWMVQGLKTRETRLQETLGKLRTAQSQVLESIEYASCIQRSFLPSTADLHAALGEHFLLWMPRDGVGGDAYWVKRQGPVTFLAVVDCTGHGVPGAFLTLIVNSLFEQHFDDHCRADPGRLLAKMNRGLKNALSQHGQNTLSDDGLEGGVCCIDGETGLLHYAGARGYLLLFGSCGVSEIRGDRSGVGFAHVPPDQAFTNHAVPLDSFRTAYLFTDGVTDQIGGSKRLPLGRRALKDCLAAHAALPMDEQRRRLLHTFEDHKGRNVQRDDVTVLGFAARGI